MNPVSLTSFYSYSYLFISLDNISDLYDTQVYYSMTTNNKLLFYYVVVLTNHDLYLYI